MLRPLAIANLHNHYKNQITEPNKLSFISIIVGAPLFTTLVVFPLLDGQDKLKLDYTTALGVCLICSAYWLVSEMERVYLTDRIIKLNLTTLFPLNNHESNKFLGPFNYVETQA
jgi:hypothetical protein